MNENEIVAALEQMQMIESTDNDEIVPRGMRSCPICGQKMLVEIIRDAKVDVCQQHGIWLDNGELPAIIARASSIDAASRLNALRQAKRDGKICGALFGLWSFLMD